MEWKRSEVRYADVLGLVWLVMVAPITIGAAVEEFRSGQPERGANWAFCSVLLVHAAGLKVVALLTPRLRRGSGRLLRCPVCDEHDAVVFRYSGWARYRIGSMTAFLAGGFGGVLGVPLAMYGDGVRWHLFGVACLAVATYLSWLLLTMVKLAPGGVALCPNGIHHQELTYTQFIPWETVSSVRTAWEYGPVIVVDAVPSDRTHRHRYGRGFLRVGKWRWLPGMCVRGSWLAVDPVLVYYMLLFHHLCPERRSELGTSVALDLDRFRTP